MPPELNEVHGWLTRCLAHPRGGLEDNPAFRRLNTGPRQGRVVNEVLGFLVRCVLVELAAGRSPVITAATAGEVGGSRAAVLLELATRSGITVAGTTADDGREGWALAEDGPFCVCEHPEQGWTLCVG